VTAILGISAFYHDSAAALVVDGKIVAAAQEERFTRKKHDECFPSKAIDYCLSEAGLTVEQLDYVGFYEKPLTKFDRLLSTYVGVAPQGFKSFCMAMPQWLKDKLYLPRAMRKGLGGKYRKQFVFVEHHESHAASAFFPCPFEDCAILTLDGVGEWDTASFGVGRGHRIDLSHVMHFPHSLGLLYSAFTYFTGFKVNSGEYKLMGLAPYGEPRYVDLIMNNLIDLKEDGSFRMDMSYFNYCQGLTMTNAKFARLFGGPERKGESLVTQREMDLAASVQKVTEEIMLRTGRHLHQVTGMKKLCMAGGVALNCVANGRLLREGPFDDIWIQPAAGDAGGALGTALFVWHQLLENPRTVAPRDQQGGSLLGPRYEESRIREFLDRKGVKYHYYDNDEDLCKAVADIIASDKVAGWVQGRMEFGPRALGCRSIVGDPRSTNMQANMNVRIKFRESFRPFAPSVLEERVDEFFEMRPREQSPYMLLVAPVRESQRIDVNGEAGNLFGIDKLKVKRSLIPAITHVDYSARVQTVDPDRHGRYYKLIKAFEARTGCPIVINTSFNVRGEPIVCTPEDAYRCFMGTNMDALVLERFVLLKTEQPGGDQLRNEEYLKQFALD
jgi:carbamoyltransferase